MARSKAGDYDVKRQVILDAAAKLFAQRGYPNSSVTAIARRSGASKSKIYHYFSSKEAILFEILKDYCHFTLANYENISDSTSPAEKLRTFLQTFIERPPKMRYRHIALVNDLKHLSERSRRQVVALERRMVDHVMSLLREVPGTRAVDEAVQRTYVLLLFGAINGIDTWYDPSGLLAPSDLSSLVADLFLKAAGASPGPEERSPPRARAKRTASGSKVRA